jgi:hypothetical protein
VTALGVSEGSLVWRVTSTCQCRSDRSCLPVPVSGLEESGPPSFNLR